MKTKRNPNLDWSGYICVTHEFVMQTTTRRTPEMARDAYLAMHPGKTWKRMVKETGVRVVSVDLKPNYRAKVNRFEY